MKTLDFFDPIPESLRKSLELQNKIQDSMQPILEQEEKIKKISEITEGVKLDLPKAMFSSPTVDAIAQIEEMNPYKVIDELTSDATIAEVGLGNYATPIDIIGNSVMKFANYFSDYQISSGMYDAISTFEKSASIFGNAIQTFIENASSALTSVIESPMMQWLQSFDFTPIWSFFDNFDLECDFSDRYKELNGAYLTAMYECKWFPYAGWSIDIRMFSTISEIISASRGASKRREKRIDDVIFAYYTKSEIKNIKRTWKNSDLDPHIKKILGQAIEAHLRGEYVLTTTCLATMWEGLIHKKLNVKERLGSKKTREAFKDLIGDNDFDPIFAEFYENFIVCDCNSPDEVIEGIPNRNGISHSKYKKYPNKKASLNAILLTDFIIGLKPKEMVVKNKEETEINI